MHTTITKSDQEAAFSSLRRGVLDYDRRHGYRGAEAFVNMADIKSEHDEALDEMLQDYQDSDDLHPAIVLDADAKQIRAYRRGGEIVTISGDGLKFAARMIDQKAPPNKRITRGAIIRVQQDEKDNWRITQMPEVEASFISIDPQNGAIRSLVGGFDYNRNKFNHTTQPGGSPVPASSPSSIRAHLRKGSAGVHRLRRSDQFSASVTGSQAWEPKNYDGKYEGPMRLRTALAKSKNMVSIRLLQASGVLFIQDYATRFGFDADSTRPI